MVVKAVNIFPLLMVEMVVQVAVLLLQELLEQALQVRGMMVVQEALVHQFMVVEVAVELVQ